MSDEIGMPAPTGPGVTEFKECLRHLHDRNKGSVTAELRDAAQLFFDEDREGRRLIQFDRKIARCDQARVQRAGRFSEGGGVKEILANRAEWNPPIDLRRLRAV